jgi:hypothetical protein
MTLWFHRDSCVLEPSSTNRSKSVMRNLGYWRVEYGLECRLSVRLYLKFSTQSRVR